jgi:thiamine pyrophosphokinase
MKKVLIIANGEFLPAKQLRALARSCCVLALDGAADRLKKLKILPDILLGDFDSLDKKRWRIQPKKKRPYKNSQGILIVPAYDQRHTDLQKAIAFCDTKKFDAIAIVCATNGRFDHTIANVRLLKRVYKPHRPIVLYTQDQSLRYLHNETLEFHGASGDFIGIFGFPAGKVTTQGLKFELHNAELKFAENESVSNELRQPRALIRVKGDVLLVGSKLLR